MANTLRDNLRDLMTTYHQAIVDRQGGGRKYEAMTDVEILDQLLDEFFEEQSC